MSKKKNDFQEYNMLRNEMLQYLSEAQTVRNMMYVLTVTILGFSLSREQSKILIYVYLLPLIVIIPSFIIAIDYWKCIVKAATYLQVFYESIDDCPFKWESRIQAIDKEFDFMTQKYYQHLPYILSAIVCILLYFCNISWWEIGKCDNKHILFQVILGSIILIICIGVYCKFRQVNREAYLKHWQQVKTSIMEK